MTSSADNATNKLTLELMQQQNASTSNAIIQHYNSNQDFQRLATYEGDLTVRRDQEDADKLQLGIEFAQDKGVIDRNFVPDPYVEIDVLGKTPDQVAQVILDHVQKDSDNKTAAAASTGSVICLVGLSGTGKGTTVSKLRQRLEQAGHQVTTWSNGNIFRSVTLLAATWCQQNCKDDKFDADAALTKENLASFMSMLSFGKHPVSGVYDTRIQGLGLDLYVSDVQNTTLKSPAVSQNIPTVAQFTQGEVIMFAADAVQTMGQDGIYVLLEGREQTVNYVCTPQRFCLILSDESLIGKRRAAQRLMAQALHDLNHNDNNNKAADADVPVVLDAALQAMVKDISRK